jgi:hypothetical protein
MKNKYSKAEIEFALQGYLESNFGKVDGYYAKLAKKKDSSSKAPLPESRPFGVETELAHKVYNWAYHKEVPGHKAVERFLLTYKDALDFAPERPEDADNFAMRYHKAKRRKKE